MSSKKTVLCPSFCLCSAICFSFVRSLCLCPAKFGFVLCVGGSSGSMIMIVESLCIGLHIVSVKSFISSFCCLM